MGTNESLREVYERSLSKSSVKSHNNSVAYELTKENEQGLMN